MARIVQYRRPDGEWSRLRSEAHYTTRAAVRAAVEAHGTVIPMSYFLGTAQHESAFALNVRATEPNGFQSWGLFQIGKAEARHSSVGDDDDTMLSLDGQVRMLIRLAEKHRAMFRQHMGLAESEPDPVDLCAYLAIGHNQGMGAALKTVAHHGMDWPAYKERNPTIRIVSSGYGDDVLPHQET